MEEHLGRCFQNTVGQVETCPTGRDATRMLGNNIVAATHHLEKGGPCDASKDAKNEDAIKDRPA